MAPRNDELEREWRHEVMRRLEELEERTRHVETGAGVSNAKLAAIIIGLGTVLSFVIEAAKHFLLKP